jgi:hypothetical protein
VRVQELRDLLAVLPGTLLVTVEGQHVDMLERAFEYSRPVAKRERIQCDDCGVAHEHLVAQEWMTFPAAIDLSGPRRLAGCRLHRGMPEPPVYYRGRWTKAMREVIDRYSDEPDAVPASGRSGS